MSMIIDLLPTLNEGDEHVSLGDILAIRDTCLSELELWAVCKECCLAIQGVHVSSDMFQTLCITPDSLAFDQSGTVFFLDLYTDPEPMYVPPEYESVGNSYKAHLYSLGMTLLYAAEYNVSMDSSRTFSTDLGQTINRMTLDDFDERASLVYVLEMCSKYLEGHDSDRLCQQIVSIAQSDTSFEDDRLSNEVDDLLPMNSSPQHDHHDMSSSPTSLNIDTKNSASGTTSPVDSKIQDIQHKESGGVSRYSPSLLSKTNSRKRASPDDLSSSSTVVEPPENYQSKSGTSLPNQITDDYDSEDSGTPRKVKKSVVNPLNKRDPLEAILGSSIIEGESDPEESIGKEASLEDITFIPEPPLSNDLDLKQWDTLFPLPPPLTSEPQMNSELPPGDTTDISFDEDLINVSPMNSSLSVSRSENDNSVSDKTNTCNSMENEGNSSLEAVENVSFCDLNQLPSLNIPKDVTSSKVTDQIIIEGDSNGNNIGANPAEENIDNNNRKSEDRQTRHLESIKSPLNTPSLELGANINPDQSQGIDIISENVIKDSIKPVVTTANLSDHIDEGLLYSNKPQPSKHTLDNVLESPSNLSEAASVNNNPNGNNLTTDSVTDNKISSSIGDSVITNEVTTIKFNTLFGGKHVQRDTSQDTLSLPQAQDIIKSGNIVGSDQHVINDDGVKSIEDLNSAEDNVFVSGDLNDGSCLTEKNSEDKMDKSISRKRSRDRSGSSNEEGQSVMQVLERLRCSLLENEVWALCRECVLSMQRNRLQLPAYVSLETVVIEDTGRVTYKTVPEDKELEMVFLAPELQQYGVVTEKTCLFGVAAMLWSAADYRLPANQEPALSVELENLLISMTQDDSDLRPTAIEVLQTCNEFQKKQNTTSTQICQSLASEARKALAFGKENNLIQDFIEEKIENEVKSHKAEVVQSLKGPHQVTLKPASDRPVAEAKVQKKSQHEMLMEQIQKPSRKLRRSSKPKIMGVVDIFLNNPDLIEGLKRVTGKHNPLPDEHSPIPTQHQDGSSAFKSVLKHSGSTEGIGEEETIPDAFNSKATHFSPIVLSDKNKQQQSKSKSTIGEKDVSDKIKQLKKKLLKNRPPLTLVSDLEKEVMQEEEVGNQGQTGHQPLPTSPNVQLHSPQNPSVMSSPGGMMHQSSSVNQMQGQYQQGQLNGNIQLSTSVPNLAYQYPMAPAPAMPYGMQMQLQHDPRTGLFQLVPVPTALPVQTVPVQQPYYQNTNMPHISTTSTGQYTTLQGMSLSPIEKPIRSSSPPSGSSTDGEKPERRRYIRKKHHKDKQSSSRQSDSDSGSRSSNRYSSNGTSSNKSQSKSGYKGNSRTHDLDHELDSIYYGAGHHNKGELSPVLEKRAPVPRASSVDLIERYENGNSQPRTPRTVKMRDMRNKLKRAQSGSSIDFKKNLNNEQLKPIEIYDDTKLNVTYNKDISSHLSISQPNLESDLVVLAPDVHIHKHSKSRTLRSERRKTDPASPEIPSPPLSPSLSKDSGVSGMNVKTSDMSLMERLLNSDTIKHQQRLSHVVRIVRDEFAYDGYMENGIEDLAMAEYILSLGNLKWDTFYNAVTEKYCDLYFEDDVMTALYEAVNGKKPAQDRRGLRVDRVAGNTATVISVDEPHYTGRVQRQSSQGDNNFNLSSDSPSAFRPIHGSNGQQTPPQQQDIIKPRASKFKRSDFAGVNNKYRQKGQGLDQGCRSSSLHDLLVDEERENLLQQSSLLKSHSQEELLGYGESTSAGLSKPTTKPPRKGVPSSRNNVKTNGALLNNNNKPNGYYTKDQLQDVEVSTDYRHMSKLSYLVRQDSDSSSGKSDPKPQTVTIKRPKRPHSDQQIRREDSGSSEVSSQSGYGKFVFSHDAYLSTETTDGPDEPRERNTGNKPYAEVPRVGRGSVIYYSAEMEHRLRTDVKDYAAQIDVKTKESIESKMTELDQQMMMEHRNKKKTLKYYRKLVEATKSGKISNEHKAMMNKVGKQVEESNSRLDFLDSAKKHLEMLHAEQWGLDHTLLYALAGCPGDSGMLLCACDNPLLQYQLLRSPRLGIEGQFLQAGTTDGLLSYLFAQHALSEGYIHHFFYAFRYFTTSRYVYNFLIDKINAATLSLGPDADVPSKVKARGIDLLQVWIEGYYTVDFKNDNELLDDFTEFIQEKIVPVDESAELVIEVIEKCLEGKHRDLYYQDFTSREDTNNNARDEQPIKKWESFKAVFITPKSKNKGTPSKRDEASTLKRADSFTLVDYPAQALAEQLTLIQQEMFQQSHPVHYLNSKWLGVNVSLTNPVMHKSQSLQKLTDTQEGEGSSLFAGEFHGEQIVQQLIEHAQHLSFWVTAEVVSCISIKSQTSVINKFVYVAKHCQDARNFASCIAIVDGLENLIVRQLPAWKGLSTKCLAAMDELSSLKMFLKCDSLSLLQDKTKRHCPTIPSVLYFLLHIQQLEIGGFTLANGMTRWSKMKAIANVIDQIRIFKQHPYHYSADLDLQLSLHNRMEALSDQNLHSLAEHTTSLPSKKVHSSKMSNAFKKMSRKMKGGGD